MVSSTVVRIPKSDLEFYNAAFVILKEYSTVGKLKNSRQAPRVFYAFQKSRNISCAWITLSCTENLWYFSYEITTKKSYILRDSRSCETL